MSVDYCGASLEVHGVEVRCFWPLGHLGAWHKGWCRFGYGHWTTWQDGDDE